jgi:YteA family regulatory protein
MKNHEINYLKEKLISERKIAVEGVRINQELIADSNIKEDLGELSSYDNHPADQGSELFEKEKQYALEKHNINYLRQIEDSLKKIENGDYGLCESCGETIGFERLVAHPVAKLCIECQKTDSIYGDNPNLNKSRPIEEDNLMHPFGRTFTDDTDNVVFDGEDAWQSVQQYGSSSGPQDISISPLIDYENTYSGSGERVEFTETVDSVGNEDHRKQLPNTD